MDTEQKKYNIKQIIYKFLQENKLVVGFYLFLMLSYPLESVMIPHLYGRIIDTTSKSNPSNIFKNTKKKNKTLPPVPIVEKRKKKVGLSKPQVENN